MKIWNYSTQEECDAEDIGADPNCTPAGAAVAFSENLRDGWDYEWPITVMVRWVDGSLHRIEVDRECLPFYRAVKAEVVT